MYMDLLMIILPDIVRLVSTTPFLEVFDLLHLVCINVISHNQGCQVVKHSDLLRLCREVNINDAL
jgi:hypothetical protein